MMKLTKGQAFVLALAATPMAAVGVAGAVATYANMDRVLNSSASAMGMVAAGEGATLIAALVALAVTLMGQHTPTVVRAAMWLLPTVAAAAGVALAPNHTQAVTMGVTPLAMTAAGEGVAFVARRVVAYRTGVDIEQQRRSGMLMWHANRAANGGRLGRKLSKAAVWRLSKAFASTDAQLSVQLGEVQRFRIAEGADVNLAAVLSGGAVRPSAAPVAQPRSIAPTEGPQALSGPSQPQDGDDLDDHFASLKDVLNEAEDIVARDPGLKLLSIAEVADLKGCAQGTVRSWKHRGKLVPVAVVDGSPMFSPVDVAKLD